MTTQNQTDTTAQPSIMERTRTGAHHAADSTRDAAQNAAKRTGDAIETNPIAALAGGIAIGAALGAMLPRTDVEREHLGPVGKRIADGAGAAMRAARDAGKEELGALAPDREKAKEKAASIIGSVASAAKESARASSKA